MRHDRHAALCVLAAAAIACSREEPIAELDTNSPEAVEARCAGPSAPIITAGGIGPVRLGARPSEIAERCPVRDTTLEREGDQEPATLVRVGGGSVILMTSPGDSTITGVMVFDTAYRTERGVGVGSTVGDLRLGHGRICALTGHGEVVVAAAQMPGVTFATSAAAGAIRGVDDDADLLPDTTRITRLWIDDGQSLCGGS